MKRRTSLAAAAIAASMVIFGTIGLFRRWIPLPSDVLAFIRGILGSAFLMLFLKLQGKKLNKDKMKPYRNRLVISGAMIGINWILLFEAYRYTTVAIATLCYYLQPVIVLMTAPLILHEKMTGRQLFCAAVAVCGMFLVADTGSFAPGGNGLGILLGLGAAVLYAAVVLMNKTIIGVPAYEKTIVQLFSAAAVLIPYMLINGSFRLYPLTAMEGIAVLITGIVHTGIAYALYFGAVEYISARSAAVMSYIDPVTAVLLSALFLHEPLSLRSAIGAVLILGSALFSEMI